MKRILVAAVIAALAAGACGDPTPPPAPTPVTPTITDVFNGTLQVSTTNSHPFVVRQIGGIQVTLNSATPLAALGLAVGTPSTATGTCVALQTVTAVPGTSVQLAGTASIVGNFCVAVSDVGNLVEPVEYTITVLHS